VKSALAEASELAETTLRGVRDLSQLLHPSMLDDFGLPTTLTAYLRSYGQRTGIRAQLAETIEHRFSPAMEVAIYRIVQEALNNVARHSGATACTVLLSVDQQNLHLTIDDNGRGIDAAVGSTPARRGLGLLGMRERAQALGGTFLATSADGGGTRICVTLPLAAGNVPSESGVETEVA
jgi:signal transduction histidine kinase